MKLPVLVTRVPPSATPTSLLESLMTKYGLPGHTARDYCLVTRTDQVCTVQYSTIVQYGAVHYTNTVQYSTVH